MEREGFIKYYQSIPNLALFDLPYACFSSFRVSDLAAKQNALQKLRVADGVIDMGDFLGEEFAATIASPSEEDAQEKVRRLSDIVGATKFQRLPAQRFPSPRRTLDTLDWQLMRALRYDALRPTRDISSELGITYRMTEYRINKLLDSQAIIVRGVLDSRDQKGVIFYTLSLLVDEALQEQITSLFNTKHQSRIWSVFDPHGPAVLFNMFSTSIAVAEDDLLEALSLPGVETGSLSVLKGWIELTRPNWIDKLLEEKAGTN